MSDDTAKPRALPAELQDVVALALPEPAPEVQSLEAAPAPIADEIRKRMGEIDLNDSQSIINFGAGAQQELTVISSSMLADVRNKDVGPAGDALRQMVTALRGFSVSELDTRRERSWWERLTGRAAPFAKFIARYETVQKQIDAITDDLDSHQHKLLIDIKSLDRLYEKTLEFYDQLGLYIAAGEARLKQLDEVEIPAKAKAAEAAAETDRVMAAQELRDLRAARDDLDRRVHDLRLTRQVTMQSLPSIRLVQENDKSLVTKIGSTLVNTVPLWETQLAQAVTIQRSREAAQAVKAANDLTNELLTANAENLQQANREVRKELERGIFDIAAVQKANDTLIATLNESLSLSEEGRRKRREAETQLTKMESDLRDTLAAARARAETRPTAGGIGNG